MAGQADFADSNIALLGSDLEKEVRLEAAKTVEAYKGSGQKVGLEIWRIEKFKVVKWPENKYGTFFSGDSFIVLKTYKESEEKPKLLYDIHFWLGSETTQDEMGVAAYMTVVLDDLLGTLPVQYREVQDYETDKFLNLWGKKGGIKILEGGIESGFNHIAPKDYKPRLMHVKGTKNSMRVREVPLSSKSMNHGDVFILDNGLDIVEWHGDNAGVFEKRRGREIVNSLKEERNYKAKSTICDGTDDHETLWDIVGPASEIGTAESGGDDQKAAPEQPNALFRLSDAGGSLEITEAGSGALKKSMLDSADVFIVDVGVLLYCWVGSGASKNERRKGMKYATDFLAQNGRPMHTPIVKVIEGAEPADFHHVFVG
uniref:Fragmin A n=1 Tax=Hirondellea gigas TaxID=1518452 RepID=A0A6A7FZX5_9CRUS